MNIRSLLFASLLLACSPVWAADRLPLVIDASNRPVQMPPGDRLRLPIAGPFYTAIAPSATADRVLTLPDATTTLAGLSVAQSWSALQTFTDATWKVTGSSDATKKLAFEVDAQTTGKVLTIDTGAQTLDRTLSVPVLSGTDTIATLAVANSFSAAQTISNATASTSPTTGALIVTGGTGISGRLWVGGTDIRMISTAPQLWYTENDASADNGKWAWVINGEVLKLRTLNDAESVANDIFSITRSGATVGTITIGGATTQATNWAQTGATTISTGTGTFTHNGDTTIVSGKTLTIAGLTSGRIPSVSTAGLITDNPNLTWASTTGIYSISSLDGHINEVSDSGTTNVSQALLLSHASAGTPAAGFGVYQGFRAKSATVNSRFQALFQSEWVDATDVSRTAKIRFYAYDTAAREGICVQASGSAAMLGFYGATAVVKPTSTTDLRAALINLGLYTTGGATPLDLNGGALTAATLTCTATTGTAIVATSFNTNGLVNGLNFKNASNGGSATTQLVLGNDAAATGGYIFLNSSGNTTFAGANSTNVGSANALGLLSNNLLRVTLSGANVTFEDAINMAFNTSTGTKIGTGTTQKIGFWNATPIAQKTGYGTPTGNVQTTNFPGATATLLQTSQELAQLLLDLKAAGIIGN